MDVRTNLFQARWEAEVRLMHNTFPAFQPFVSEGLLTDIIGFEGPLESARGKVYTVRIKVRGSKYPAAAPKIYISPRIGPNWYPDGSLCVNRQWRPERDTFAQQVLYAAHYVQRFG
jgi:ubiquitin-protein ligase